MSQLWAKLFPRNDVNTSYIISSLVNCIGSSCCS